MELAWWLCCSRSTGRCVRGEGQPGVSERVYAVRNSLAVVPGAAAVSYPLWSTVCSVLSAMFDCLRWILVRMLLVNLMPRPKWSLKIYKSQYVLAKTLLD